MSLVLLTFLLTTALYGALALLAWQRLARHLKDNPQAVEAFTRHILLPLLGRTEDDTKKDVKP